MHSVNSSIKRALLVNDFSCFGKCSLSVQMPIISSYGIETAALPTAVLSAHTGFMGYVMRDMTDLLKPFSEHLIKIGVQFDCVCTGFFCSAEQIRLASHIIKTLPRKDKLIIVDPIMGDNGKTYTDISSEFISEMKKLCSIADLITPNKTEAALLSGLPYDSLEEDMLSKLNSRNIVITGVRNNNKIGYLASFSKNKFLIENEWLSNNFSGAGDVFVSTLCCELMNGCSYETALKKASDFCDECVRDTADKLPTHWYGLRFEDVMNRRYHKTLKHKGETVT